MLLLMDCGVFFMQNEIYAFFQKLIFLLKKGQVIHHNNTLLPSLIIFIFIFIFITRRRRF
tara:strand:- start:196 stop:375 length:180 start_codon:yes stop_codon:yes gene_type:complete